MRGKVPITTLINPPSSIQTPHPPSPTRASKPVDPFDSRDSSPLTALSQDSSSSAAASAHEDGTTSSAPSSLAPVTPPDGLETGRRSGLDMRLRSRLGVDRESDSRRSPKRSFGESDLEEGTEERDGSTDGRRVRRRGGSGLSNLSSASPPSIVLPPPSSPDDGMGREGDDDEDKSVLKLLDDNDESDSSLSPPPPGPKELERIRRRSSNSRLDPYSQSSTGTAPPSSVSPSSRPSPAPESQTDDTHSQSQSQPHSQPHVSPKPRPLTRRERKTLGLPKHGNTSGRSNVILIPGGRHPSRLAMRADQERQKLLVVENADAQGDESIQHEWERNGSGRKDSRGFVILNI
jgi:hypothetical protein